MTDQDIDAASRSFIAGAEKLAVPPPAADLSTVYDPADDIHFGNRTAAEQRVYNWYRAYGALARPKRILEIGVRRGYSALCLIEGAEGNATSYLGIDSGLDLPDGNAAAAKMLQARTRCAVEIVTADTRNEFPQILASFDLIHVDGDHSTTGAASDLLHVAPLARTGSVIVVDDTENPSVELGLKIALAAFGPRVIRRDAGDLHRQALLFVRDRIPPIALSVAAELCGTDPGLMLELRREKLRELGSGGTAPDPGVVADLLASIVEGCAQRFGVQVPAVNRANPDIFSGFTALAETLPDAQSVIEAAKPHVRYAAERLRGIEPPAIYGPSPKLPDAFEPGSPAYRRMLWEAACNLAEILAQKLRDAPRAAGPSVPLVSPQA